MDKIGFIATDGEPAIASQENGVVGKLLKINPKIIHIHCIAHQTALGVKDLIKNFPELKGINYYIYIFYK